MSVSETAAAEYQLDSTRRELHDLFIPPEHEKGFDEFPRSKTMKALLGNRGLAALAVGAGGLLLARPKLIVHLVRMIPIGALARVAAARFIGKRL